MSQARAVLHPQAIQLAHVLTAEVLEQIAAHQLIAQRHENSLLHLLAADGQAIGARAAQILMALVAYYVATSSPTALAATLGFAFGSLVYLCIAELLPEAYHTAGRTSIAVVASVAAGVVALLGGGAQ